MNKRDFENLVHECHAEVFRSALLLSGDANDAADLVQEVYLDVARGSIDLGGSRSALSVLRWYVVRRALMQKRASSRRRRTEKSMPETETLANNPQSELIDLESREILWTEVLALPDDLRRPLVLRFREELTLSRIGEVLSLPVQTVHDRLQRAQEQLRQRLVGQGLASLSIPDLLGVGKGPAIPLGLEARLLATGQKMAAALVLKSVAALVLALVGVAAVLELNQGPDEDKSLSRPASESLAAFAPRRNLQDGDVASFSLDEENSNPTLKLTGKVSPGSDAKSETLAFPAMPASDHRVEVSGRIVDGADRPLVGALVRLSSYEHVLKEARFNWKQRSGFDGSFCFQVPTVPGESRAFRLRSDLHDHESQTISGIELGSNKAIQLGDLTMKRRVEGVDAHLDLQICSRQGKKLSGVRVELLPEEAPFDVAGAIGHSDSEGRLGFMTTRPGLQRLRVDGRACGHESRLINLDLADSSSRIFNVVLEEGRRLEVVAVDGEGNLARGLGLTLVDPRDPDHGISADHVEGHYVFQNLAPVSHQLSNRGGPWSSFRLPNVNPDAGLIRVVVKQRSDPRDVGLHGAEFHFSLIDGARGLRVDSTEADVDVIPVRDDEVEKARQDRAPWLAPGFITQKRALRLPLDPKDATVRVPGWSQIDGLEEGDYIFVIRHPQFAPRVLGPYRFHDAEIRREPNLELSPKRLIEGRVLDASGQGLFGVLVVPGGEGPFSESEATRILGLFADNPHSQKILVAGSVLTGPDGRFEIHDSDPRLGCLIYGFHPDLKIARSESIRPQDTGSITIIMQE